MKSEMSQLVFLLFIFMSSVMLAQQNCSTPLFESKTLEHSFTNLYARNDTEILDSTIITRGSNETKRTYKYYSNDKLLSITNQTWEDSLWRNIYREIFTYDSNWNISMVFKERWGIPNKWQNYLRDTYTCDSTGNVTLILTEQVNNEQWSNRTKITYTYNSIGNKILDLIENWEDNAWKRYREYIYTYTNGKVAKITNGHWVHSSWVQPQTYYTYNSDNLVTSSIAACIKNVINPNGTPRVIPIVIDSCQKTTYTYDTHNNMVLRWSGGKDTTEWGSGSKNIYTYNSNGSIVVKIHQVRDDYNQNNRGWKTYSKTEYFYRSTTDIKKENISYLDYSLSQNYPNPFNPNTTINYSLPKAGFVQLKVYDLLGREVATLINKEQTKGNYKINFNASNLTSGIYFYKLESCSFSDTKKLILLR